MNSHNFWPRSPQAFQLSSWLSFSVGKWHTSNAVLSLLCSYGPRSERASKRYPVTRRSFLAVRHADRTFFKIYGTTERSDGCFAGRTAKISCETILPVLVGQNRRLSIGSRTLTWNIGIECDPLHSGVSLHSFYNMK